MDTSFLHIFNEFANTARKNPTKKAISFKRRHDSHLLRYSELYSRIISLSSLIHTKGIKKGDKIAILLGSQPEWPISFFAIQRIGAIAVPIDICLSLDEIKRLLEHSGARMLLCSEESYAHLRQELKDRINLEILCINSLALSSDAAEDEFKSIKISPDDIAALFYTSGTTNIPKAVMLSHRNLLSNVASIKKLDALKASDVFISLLPLHHTYSFMATCLAPLLLGGEIAYPLRLSAKDITSYMKDTKTTILVGVPQIFMLFHHSIKEEMRRLPFLLKPFLAIFSGSLHLMRKYLKINFSKHLFSKAHKAFGGHLRFMISGGARLDADVAGDFFKWGFTILEGYGLTETSPIATFNPPAKQKIGSAGKAVPGVEIKIIGADKDGTGEVAIKGQNVMVGYYNLPKETAEVLKEDWFFSGDLGYLDRDGYLYLVGRKDEMIVLSSGENINPEEIESHYNGTPCVKEICVFSSKGTGYFKQANQLVAVVVPDEVYFRKQKIVNIDEKIRWELDRLSYSLRDYKRIRGFAISKNSLPKTALGKVMRHKVEDEYSKRKPVTSEKDQEPLGKEELALLSSEGCQNALRHLSSRLKKEVKISDHLELDLGIDSLGRIELLLELQEILNMKVPESEMEAFFYSSTIKELLIRAKPYLSEDIKESDKKEFLWSEALNAEPAAGILETIRLKPLVIDRIATSALQVCFRIFFLIFFRFEVRNKKDLPESGPFIIFANHTSYLDGLAIPIALPFKLLKNTFIVGFREVFTSILSKGWLKRIRLIPIDITLNLVDALHACAYLLKHSKIVCLFPEGQRAPDSNIMRFKKGIGILTKEVNAKLVPAYISGTFEAWSRRSKFLRPCKVKVTIGKTLTYSDVLSKLDGKEANYENISEVLRRELIDLQKTVK